MAKSHDTDTEFSRCTDIFGLPYYCKHKYIALGNLYANSGPGRTKETRMVDRRESAL